MGQITIDVPDGYEEEFLSIFRRILEKVEVQSRFEILNKILEESQISSDQAEEITGEVKERIAKRHGINY